MQEAVNNVDGKDDTQGDEQLAVELEFPPVDEDFRDSDHKEHGHPQVEDRYAGDINTAVNVQNGHQRQYGIFQVLKESTRFRGDSHPAPQLHCDAPAGTVRTCRLPKRGHALYSGKKPPAL